jgi:hypothetical protein
MALRLSEGKKGENREGKEREREAIGGKGD